MCLFLSVWVYLCVCFGFVFWIMVICGEKSVNETAWFELAKLWYIKIQKKTKENTQISHLFKYLFFHPERKFSLEILPLDVFFSPVWWASIKIAEWADAKANWIPLNSPVSSQTHFYYQAVANSPSSLSPSVSLWPTLPLALSLSLPLSLSLCSIYLSLQIFLYFSSTSSHYLSNSFSTLLSPTLSPSLCQSNFISISCTNHASLSLSLPLSLLWSVNAALAARRCQNSNCQNDVIISQLRDIWCHVAFRK